MIANCRIHLTNAVGHGLLLEIHVHVVGVEAGGLVRGHARAQREQEARRRPEELRPQRPRVGREAAERVPLLQVQRNTVFLISEHGPYN